MVNDGASATGLTKPLLLSLDVGGGGGAREATGINERGACNEFILAGWAHNMEKKQVTILSVVYKKFLVSAQLLK